MAMDKHLIMGLHITDRVKHATQIQAVLTEYGCCIKTRLGLHEVGEGFCSNNGVLLLECIGDEANFNELASKLNAIEGAEAKTMVFDHP